MPEVARPPVQPLHARLAGHPPDATLYEGVPPHLTAPLRAWGEEFLTPPLQRRVALHLRIPLGRSELGEALAAAQGRSPHLVNELRCGSQLLDAIDLALQLDDQLDWEIRHNGRDPVPWELPPVLTSATDLSAVPLHWPDTSPRAQTVDRLDRLLRDAGSVFEVQWSPAPPRLMRRADPTVAHTFMRAAATATPTAGRLLRDAWQQTYRQLHPDPTAAYGNAVRAVEHVLCPLVVPTSPRPTLGAILAYFRDAPQKWVFVLRAKDGTRDIEPLVVLLRQLWEGQHDRHGGGPDGFQPQTRAEAQAAVHLATTVVQWITSGALTRTDAT